MTRVPQHDHHWWQVVDYRRGGVTGWRCVFTWVFVDRGGTLQRRVCGWSEQRPTRGAA